MTSPLLYLVLTRRRRFEKTLHAILSEKELLGCKVIVIDDGSTDTTVEKIKKFADVQLIRHGLNKGYGSSIASGCRAAKSKYVVFGWMVMDSIGQKMWSRLSKS